MYMYYASWSLWFIHYMYYSCYDTKKCVAPWRLPIFESQAFRVWHKSCFFLIVIVWLCFWLIVPLSDCVIVFLNLSLSDCAIIVSLPYCIIVPLSVCVIIWLCYCLFVSLSDYAIVTSCNVWFYHYLVSLSDHVIDRLYLRYCHLLVMPLSDCGILWPSCPTFSIYKSNQFFIKYVHSTIISWFF